MPGHLPSNLPAPRSSLIGRESDVLETCRLLLNGPERLITLTGVGGSGKTRLALRVVTDLRDSFPDGVWLIELARINDPLLVPDALADALGFAEVTSDGEPSSDRLLDRLVASLQSRTSLIVLDNCEHLIDACASLADTLLSACPDLRILATSREPLQISGERQRRVRPLPVPVSGQTLSLEELIEFSSVQLFVERANAVEPTFRLTEANAAAVARICMRLDGIPLALELAAARVRVLSLDQIAQRLDDCFRLLVGNARTAPTRQQTLKAALDWSYNLLSVSEQTAFRRMAVFVGDWGLEVAEAVCAEAGSESADVLDLISRLVDKSLVMVEEHGTEARYRLLEPVRQYAGQLLAASGETDSAWDRLTQYCIDLAERAKLGLHGPDQHEFLRQLDRDFDNIRAVLRWAEERRDAVTILRLVGSLYWYCWIRRHLREGLRWLDSALGMSVPVPDEVRAEGLFAIAFLLALVREHARGLVIGREVLDLYRRLGNLNGLAFTTVTLAAMTLDKGDMSAAHALADESVAMARESGWRWVLGHALVVLGQILHRQGDTAQAVDYLEQATALFQEQRDREAVAYAINNLISLRTSRPDLLRAAALTGLQREWQQNNRRALADALEYLAFQEDVPEKQVRLFAAAHSLRKSIGVPLPIVESDDVERRLAVARTQLGDERFAAVWADGQASSLDEVVAGALALNEEQSTAFSERPVSSTRRSPNPLAILTRRELDVVKLLARGYTDRQIAEELTIAVGTAGVHVHHILEKLGLRSRVQVVDWAVAQQVIER